MNFIIVATSHWVCAKSWLQKVGQESKSLMRICIWVLVQFAQSTLHPGAGFLGVGGREGGTQASERPQAPRTRAPAWRASGFFHQPPVPPLGPVLPQAQGTPMH